MNSSAPPPLPRSLSVTLVAGDIEKTKAILATGPCGVNCVDRRGRTPLHIACKYDHLDLVRVLVDVGSDLNSEDYYGYTPLSLAIRKGCNRVVSAMIDEFNFDIWNRGESSLLHTACINGNINLVRTLIKHGINVTKDCNKNSPLILAAKYNNYEVVLALLEEFRCHPNVTGNHGMSSLHRACCNGNLKMIRTLIEFGASTCILDDKHNSPLFLAALNGRTEVALVLLSEFKCDPNHRCIHGMTPLHVASSNGNLPLVHVLIRHGANINIRNHRNNTPLAFAIGNSHYEVALVFLKDSTCEYDSTARYFGDQTLLHIACSIGEVGLFKTLINAYGSDLNARDGHNDTILNIAVAKGERRMVLTLLKEFSCDPNTKGYCGLSPLHVACSKGHLSIALTLIKHGADLNARDYDSNTPLTLAVRSNRLKLMTVLIKGFECDPNHIDGSGASQLHIASHECYFDMIETLVNCGADVNIKDHQNSTPLSEAIERGNYDVALTLLRQAGCEYDSRVCYSDQRTLLHIACCVEHISLASTLIHDYGSDLNARDVNNDTPLILAIKSGNQKVALALLREFKCDANITGWRGKSPLQVAYELGNKFLVLKLLREFKCNPNSRDVMGVSTLYIASGRGDLDIVQTLMKYSANVNTEDNKYHTAIMSAIEGEKYEVVLALLGSGNCKYDSTTSYSGGWTLLHIACSVDHMSLARTLICGYGANVNARDTHGDTPLMIAVKRARNDIAVMFLKEFKCDANISDARNRSPLHVACAAGNIRLVQALVQHGSANLNFNGPLVMGAVQHNRYRVMAFLISHCGCDISVQTKGGSTLLHLAAIHQNIKVLKILIDELGMSPLVIDSKGNTPLHISSQFGKHQSVKSLLIDYHASVFARNMAGETPRDLAKCNPDVTNLIDDYIARYHGTLEADYKSMQLLAEKKYSGSHCITRVFVVGHPGAGKSSLVEALKREKFFQSRNKVSQKTIPPHTAGIVPSVYMSSTYGRVQFYDFAGDPEYYSSHAAILEKLLESEVGHNICIIVLDLQEEDNEIENKYLYWTTFIGHNSKNLQHLLSFIVAGSHSDLLHKKEAKRKREHIETLLRNYKTDHVYMSLDCRNPASKNINPLRQHMQDIAQKYELYRLSFEESILLGLLEKDFSNVTACTAKTLVTHIKEVNLLRLPRNMTRLYPLLKSLQAIGTLLLLGGNKENCYLVLNITQLTNEVHKQLFSKEAFSGKAEVIDSFNIGLLPQSLLGDILPQYITKECLTQLQYCQEISDVEIGQDLSIFPGTESSIEGAEVCTLPDKSLLFFPALIRLDKSNVSWVTPPEGNYSLGWLARRSNSPDYFSSRFLHVLLLRIALRFTLIAPPDLHQACKLASPDHVHLKRRCNMWKSGVHWLTEEGVECEVDVDISKEVTVSVRCQESYSKNCLTIFNSIISCIMEAKAEFCHSVQLQFFLLHKIGSLDDDNLYRIKDAESVLENGKNMILSVSGKGWMPSTKLLHIRSTFWESLFAMNEHSIMESIEDVQCEWQLLGLNLQLPSSTLNAIEISHPRDVKACNVEMVSAWLSSSHESHPPCWWSLVKALQVLGENTTAAAITEQYGEHIVAQKKLLESECHGVKPDGGFLQSFARVVESKWLYLAALLSLNSDVIQEVRKEGKGLSQRDHALLMLGKWACRDEATYGLLFETLKPVSLFQLCK